MRKIFLAASISLLCIAGACAQGASSTSASTSTTTETKKKPPVFRANKGQIKQVQTMLAEKKLYTGETTGTLTDPTRAAIKGFQRDNGLKATGTLNRATLEKFGVELTESQKAIPVSESSFATADKTESSKSKPAKQATATTAGSEANKPKRPAPFRATVDQIKAAQKMLKEGKMYAGDEAGKLDDATRGALKKYQEANGLRIMGSLNAATLEKMGIALTEKQKEQVAAQAAYDAAKVTKN
ncbi:MAG TPA: peptidoglycan-binding domain-containing protein [Pyrinomonadaceae bacterium]|nr:peptidoglycan-binding domain-containing protein [Pyrinomonadaceae bacterium]